MELRPGKAPPEQLDSRLAMKLHRQGAWLSVCPHATKRMPCQDLQGGRAGLLAHILTVHPDQVTRAEGA